MGQAEVRALDTYSLDRYRGSGKWLFAIVFNKAQANLRDNPKLLDETLTRFMKNRKQEWFDEETRSLICGEDIDGKEGEVRQDVREGFRDRLNNLRNYFSHYVHSDTCLKFEAGDEVRAILERAYARARLEELKRQTEEITVRLPKLFEEDGRVTSAGVVFFVSFFVERRFLTRLMGYVAGFKESEGEYKITRDVFSKYCLRDSYSVKAQDQSAVMFRDIMGYLARVPGAAYKHMKQPVTRGDKQLSERKTEKFITFALRYLEDYEFCRLGNYKVCFARQKITRDREVADEGAAAGKAGEKEYRPHTEKSRITIHFETAGQDGFYIGRKNVILRTEKAGGGANTFVLGVYELKYLVLLSILGRGEEAIKTLDGFVHRLRQKLAQVDQQGKGAIEGYERFVPEFIREKIGLETADAERKLEARVAHVRSKWEEKKDRSRELELHTKARDILRYINERGEKELARTRYRRMFELLVAKDLEGFYSEVGELRRRRRIGNDVVRNLSGCGSVNELHRQVCGLVLSEMEGMDPAKLAEYVGLTPKEDKGVSFEQKLERARQQPVVYKGFLREQFFREKGKSFARLVEEAMQKQGPGLDVPLGVECYSIARLQRFDGDNQELYETLATDRLCVMMARRYFERMNQGLSEKAQWIEWKKVNGEDVIIFTFEHAREAGRRFSIRFGAWDFPKLYVMDEAKFLVRLVEYFLPKEGTQIEYHRLYTEGTNRYTELQKEGIEAILELEKKIIDRKGIGARGGYIKFENIIRASGHNDAEKAAVWRVRNSLLHYELNFEREDVRMFYTVMKREGIRKQWSLTI
jgi:hypothetical protein